MYKQIINSLLSCCLLGLTIGLWAQSSSYQNEWINHEQTYYPITVTESGWYRIPYTALNASNLEGNQLQLFHNGRTVPIYVTTDGVLTANDYIEFYAMDNSGLFPLDVLLYDLEVGVDLPNSFYSLFSDTLTYYLTWNNASNNHRYQTVTNNLTNLPTKEEFCLKVRRVHQTSHYFEGQHPYISPLADWQPSPSTPFNGFVQAATFAPNEGFMSDLITPDQSKVLELSTPNIYRNTSVNEASLITSKLINRTLPTAPVTVTVQTNLNNTLIDESSLNQFGETVFIDLSSMSLNDPNNQLEHLNLTPNGSFSVASTAVLYPHSFDFGGVPNITFTLPDSEEAYLEITNFNGGDAPVLVGATGTLRMTGIVDNGITKFHIPAATNAVSSRDFIVAHPNTFLEYTQLSPRQFTDFNQSAQQGNYIIITHPSLMGGVTNWVEAYADYRRSEAGGSYQVVVINIEELYAQFAWGIDQHPLAIRHFLNFAIDNWETTPEHVLLMGKSVQYDQARLDAAANQQSLVPSFGALASDQALTSRTASSYQPQLSIGRIPALNPSEIRDYLDKVMTYEEALVNGDCTLDQRLWRKRLMTINQAEDEFMLTTLRNQSEEYTNILTTGSYGAGLTHQQAVLQATGADFSDIIQQINEGVGLIWHQGEQWTLTNQEATGNIDFSQYNNINRYPFIFSSTDDVGDIHQKRANRNDLNQSSIPEQLVLTAQKGAIGFLGHSSPFPTWRPDILTIFHERIMQRLTNENYGNPIGTVILEATKDIAATYHIARPTTNEEQVLQLAVQTLTYTGDPALKVYVGDQAELVSRLNTDITLHHPETGDLLTGNPIQVGSDLMEFEVRLVVNNLGKAVKDSFDINIAQSYPDGTGINLGNQRIVVPAFKDTISFFIPNTNTQANGLNTILLGLDTSLEIDEDCDFNNSGLGVLVNINTFCEDAPIIPFAGDTIIFTGIPIPLNAGNGTDTYAWSTGENSSSILVDMPGFYSVTVTNAAGCSVTGTTLITWPVGISETLPPAISLYPNPAQDWLQLELSASMVAALSSPIHISLYNMQGQLVMEQILSDNHQINVKALKQGIYLMQVRMGEEVFYERVVKGSE